MDYFLVLRSLVLVLSIFLVLSILFRRYVNIHTFRVTVPINVPFNRLLITELIIKY